MERPMQKDWQGYPTKSFEIGPDAWYYVTRRGLEFCIAKVPGGAGQIQFILPWRRVLAAAAHHAKARVKQAVRRTSRKRR
jgi:hypothetical protein